MPDDLWLRIETVVRSPSRSTRENRSAIAAALADELSKVLNEHLTVAQAEFVEPHKSDVYRVLADFRPAVSRTRPKDPGRSCWAEKKRDHCWSRRECLRNVT